MKNFKRYNYCFAHYMYITQKDYGLGCNTKWCHILWINSFRNKLFKCFEHLTCKQILLLSFLSNSFKSCCYLCVPALGSNQTSSHSQSSRNQYQKPENEETIRVFLSSLQIGKVCCFQDTKATSRFMLLRTTVPLFRYRLSALSSQNNKSRCLQKELNKKGVKACCKWACSIRMTRFCDPH